MGEGLGFVGWREGIFSAWRDELNKEKSLAEKIEHEWETVWSCEGLSDEQLVNAILEFVRGMK